MKLWFITDLLQVFAQCQLQLQQHLSGGALPTGYMHPGLLPPTLGQESPPDVKPDVNMLVAMTGSAQRHSTHITAFSALGGHTNVGPVGPAGGLTPMAMSTHSPELNTQNSTSLSPQDHVSPGSSGDQPTTFGHVHSQTFQQLSPHSHVGDGYRSDASQVTMMGDRTSLGSNGSGVERITTDVMDNSNCALSSPLSAGRIPQVIHELLAAEPNPKEMTAKLGAIVESRLQAMAAQNPTVLREVSHGIGPLPREFLQLVCHVCDQALFLLVEWARGASFFKLFKVG